MTGVYIFDKVQEIHDRDEKMGAALNYTHAARAAAAAYSNGQFAGVVDLLRPHVDVAVKNAQGGFLLAFSLMRTGERGFALEVVDRLLINGEAGLETLQLRVQVLQAQHKKAAANRALRQAIVFAPNEFGNSAKFTRGMTTLSIEDQVNWFKRARCLGGWNRDALAMLIKCLRADSMPDAARSIILKNIDDDFKAHWLRNSSKAGQLKQFLASCPPVHDAFWQSPEREDLLETRKLVDLYQNLNEYYLVHGLSREDPPERDLGGNNSLLSKMTRHLEAVTPISTPFDHVILDKILPWEEYHRLKRQVSDAAVSWSTNHYPDRGNIFLPSTDAGDPWSKIARILERADYMTWVIWRLNAGKLWSMVKDAGFELRSDARITKDRHNYSLGPHKDVHSRFITGLFYIPLKLGQEDLGTHLYRKKQPGWTLDNGLHGDFEDYTPVKNVPYRDNSGILFLNMGDAYHGVPLIKTEAERAMIQYNIRIVRPN